MVPKEKECEEVHRCGPRQGSLAGSCEQGNGSTYIEEFLDQLRNNIFF
jgi:hypothetical protein